MSSCNHLYIDVASYLLGCALGGQNTTIPSAVKGNIAVTVRTRNCSIDAQLTNVLEAGLCLQRSSLAVCMCQIRADLTQRRSCCVVGNRFPEGSSCMYTCRRRGDDPTGQRAQRLPCHNQNPTFRFREPDNCHNATGVSACSFRGFQIVVMSVVRIYHSAVATKPAACPQQAQRLQSIMTAFETASKSTCLMM